MPSFSSAMSSRRRKLLVDVFGLTAAIDTDGWSMFPMPDGTILDLHAPQAIPDYGFNDGIVFGFRVNDIEAASAELVEAGCELLGEINRISEMSYAYRHFKGPDRWREPRAHTSGMRDGHSAGVPGWRDDFPRRPEVRGPRFG
jgi:hypothetical protein